MTSNKKNIARNLPKNLSISFEEGLKILDKFLFIIKSNSRSNLLKISGFGTFAYKKTPERIGRNPKTKESYIIPKANKLSFKASSKIKEILN
jgi:nucleoid DNA-binding protein